MSCCRCWHDPHIKDAYRLAITSLVVQLVAALIGFIYHGQNGSSLALAYGLENIVDGLSSGVVLWRFYAPTYKRVSFEEDQRVERLLLGREERAGVAISFLLVLLGIVVLLAAIPSYVRGPDDVDDDWIEFESDNDLAMLSLFSFFAFCTLTVLKFRYAGLLRSKALVEDGFCSLIGTFLSASLFFNEFLVFFNPNLWWFEPVVATGASIGAMYIGFDTLHVSWTRDGIPFFDLQWWQTVDVSSSNHTAKQGTDGGSNSYNRPIRQFPMDMA